MEKKRSQLEWRQKVWAILSSEEEEKLISEHLDNSNVIDTGKKEFKEDQIQYVIKSQFNTFSSEAKGENYSAQ